MLKANLIVAAILLNILLAGAILSVVYQFHMIGSVTEGGLEDPLEAWSESSYIVWQYNSTFYACRNMSTLIVEAISNDDDDILQYAINETTAYGGTVYVKVPTYTGTYNAAVTLKNKCTLVIERGALGITVTLADGAVATLLDYNNYVSPYSFMVFKIGDTYYAEDGTTGAMRFSGTNASLIIQNVIDALPDTGGLIFFKKALYFIDVPLNITKNSVYFEGEGYSWGFIDQIGAVLPNNGTALIATSIFPSDRFMINFYPPEGKNVTIGGGLQSLILDGGKVNELFEDPVNNTWYSGGGVFINNTHGVRIRDCTFTRHGGHGIYAYSSLTGGYLTGGGISDINIERNCIRNLGYGNYIGFGNVLYPQKASGVGIFLDIGCWVSSVINNWVTRTYDYNIIVSSWGGRIIGNELEWASVNPELDPYVEDPTNASKAVYMSGTAIFAKEYGVLVEGNHIIWPDRHGIISNGRNTIMGNNIINVNQANFTGSAGGAGIHAEGHNLNLTIVGNVITDVGDDYAVPRLMAFGIVVAGATNSSSTNIKRSLNLWLKFLLKPYFPECPIVLRATFLREKSVLGVLRCTL